MSLLSRITNGQSTRMMGSSQNPWVIPTNGQTGMGTSAGVSINADNALMLASVWGCVRIISETIAGLPMSAVNEPDDSGLKKKVKTQPQIVADPFGGNQFTSATAQTLSVRAGIAETLVSLLLVGNAYFDVVSRDGRTQLPNQLKIYNPNRVSVDTDAYGTATAYRVDGIEVDPRNIVHIRGLTLPGEALGASVISYARRTIGLGIAAEEFGSRFFSQGATLKGIVEVPGDLTMQKAREVKAAFDATHGGLTNSHLTGVLTGGAKYAPVGVPPEDAQFLGTRAAQTSDIAMMYGVPPHMLGQTDRTTSWGKGIEEQTLGFVKFTLKGWIDRLKDAWNAMLPAGVEVDFDYEELLAPDTSARYTAYMTARNAALMTINDIRAREGLPPVKGGDDIMAPLNSAHTRDPGYQVGTETSDVPPAPVVPMGTNPKLGAKAPTAPPSGPQSPKVAPPKTVAPQANPKGTTN
jgi:HK97 family phage portal protein